jgi:biotin carboxylase
MARNVVFAAPFPADITMRFVRAAARLHDVRLLGIVHTPPSGEDAHVFHDFVRVTEPLSVTDLLDATEVLRRRHGEPYRVIGMLEAIQVQLAVVRERFGVPGTRPEVAELFRDKAKMKAALRSAGLPVARSRLVHTAADAREFMHQVGFPMVLKPPAGMGAKTTFRLTDEAGMWAALNGLGVGPEQPVLLEEFLRGREFSFETITTGGVPRVHSISQYQPPCLEVLENPWIQWCCVLPRELSSPLFDQARDLGFAAVRALGLDDGMTHMEWFQRDDGSLVIGEIAQRPPGANISTMTGLAHDVDPYRAWARAVVDGAFDGPWTRKYAVGSAFLRGMGRGRVAGVTGVRETQEALGAHVVEAKLPTLGQPRADGYEGDGYVIVRHERTDFVQAAMKKIIETVKVHYAE